MKKKNRIITKSIKSDETFSYKKSNSKIEKDFNENFPKINSKYFFPLCNPNESKLSSRNNLLTDRTIKNESKNNNKKQKYIILQKSKKKDNKKFLINIKNIAIEEKKTENNSNTEDNYNHNHNFKTLNEIIINNILKKKKENKPENFISNILKEKDSDMISTTKSIEKNILEETNNKRLKRRLKKLDILLKIHDDKDKNLENNKYQNIGTNTKLSKTISNFQQTKNINNDNNNKIIYSYNTKQTNNKNDINHNNNYKLKYSRNDNELNKMRTIFTKDDNKKISYTINNNNNNSNNYNNTTNNFKNKQKVNQVFFKLLSNEIVRKVELNGQMNNKISDENVQNLLIKEIDEIKNIRMKNIKRKNNFNNDELFHNSKIKNIFNIQTRAFENNNYKQNENSKKINDFINEEIKENLLNYKNQDMILSQLKLFDLNTDIHMFDGKLKNTKLEELYLSNRKELLKDKDVIKEIGQYIFSLLTNNSKEVNHKEKLESNNEENEKNLCDKEEKNIIKDIIYQLSDDLNENLDSYKNPNKNNGDTKNSINHAIKSISLAQLFEKLNAANSTNGKKRRFNKIITDKIGSNINNNKLKGNLFKENNNSKEESKNFKGNNIDENKLINKILLNFLEKHNINNTDTNNNNNINKDEFNNNNENDLDDITLNNFIETLKKGDENIDINIMPDELKQVLENLIQQEKNRNSLNKDNFNQKEKELENPNTISSKYQFNINNINNINNIININNINNTNNTNKINKSEYNKSLSSKIKDTLKSKKNKNKKKEIKKILNKNKEKISKEILLSSSNNLMNDINTINNEYNEFNNVDEDINNNQNNNIIKPSNGEKKNKRTKEQKENGKEYNQKKVINRNGDKRSILIMKNQNENELIKSNKSNKNVKFSFPKQSNNNKKLLKNLDLETNNEILLRNISNNESLIYNDLPNKSKSNPNQIKNNQFPFDNRNNDSFFDEFEMNDIKIERKYSTRMATRKTLRNSVMDSFSKIRKKKFHKTRKGKNKNLKTLKDEESSGDEKGEYVIDIREEILNRKLKNFFGKIKMLKNADDNNYDEQLKMFIDNEIDKLNDWETKEQEIRINNFFSDLKLIKKRNIIGSDIKYVNPIKFSSTFTDFGKFKDL